MMKMKKIKKNWFLLMASLLVCGGLAAQESDFDLDSQRSESQDVNPDRHWTTTGC